MLRRRGREPQQRFAPPIPFYCHRRTRLEELMKFRPLHDRVVVRRIDAEEKTKGGIIIPDTAKEKPKRAR